MYNKKIIKSLSILTLIIVLALVYTFAQNGEPNNAVSEEESEKTVDEIETPGKPTDDDPWKEMDKLVQAYYGASGVLYKGLIKLTDDNGEQEKTLEQHPFEYSFFDGNFQYLLDSMEFVSQDKYILAIDHRSRLISLSTAGKQQTSSQLFDMKEFKKIMEEQKANAMVTQSGDEKMITIDNIQHPQIQGYRIYYDPQTYKISKMLIGVLRLSPLSNDDENLTEETAASNEKDIKEEEKNDTANEEETEIDTYSYYVEIIYKESRILDGKKEFDPVKKFLKIGKEKIELQPAFSTYQLLSASEPTE